MDTAWADAHRKRGNAHLEEGRDAEAEGAFAQLLARAPNRQAEVDTAWADAHWKRGNAYLEEGRDAEAEGAFAQLLARAPNRQAEVNTAWADAHWKRGNAHLEEGRDTEATAEFERALRKHVGQLDKVVEAQIERVENLRNERSGSQEDRAQHLSRALTVAKLGVQWASRDGAPADVLGSALFARGRVLDALTEYDGAIDDFRSAQNRGQKDVGNWLFWTVNKKADQLRAQGRSVEGLLLTWSNILDISPGVRRSIDLNHLKSNAAFRNSITALYQALATNTGNPTPCDHLASHPNDPMARAPGVQFDAIAPEVALPACTEAVRDHPGEPRLLFLRGRVHSRAASIARDAEDETGAKSSDVLAVQDLVAAAAAAYPIAFNNLGVAFGHGEGVEKDQDKASDLYLEALNHSLHCCWVPVARYLMSDEAKRDKAQVHRILAELTRWAAALGSDGADALLDDLVSVGESTRVDPLPPAKFTDLPPWLQEK